MRKKYKQEEVDDILTSTLTDDKNDIDIYKYSDVVDRLVSERKKLKKMIEELEEENEELRKQEIRIPKQFFYIIVILVFYLIYIIRSDNLKLEKDIGDIKEEIAKIKVLNMQEFREKFINKINSKNGE